MLVRELSSNLVDRLLFGNRLEITYAACATASPASRVRHPASITPAREQLTYSTSGVKPAQTKAASSRRTPKVVVRRLMKIMRITGGHGERKCLNFSRFYRNHVVLILQGS